ATGTAGLAAFLGVDSPPIDYEQLPLRRFSPAKLEDVFGGDPASNDNVTLASGGGLSGSGGGGGAHAFEGLAHIDAPSGGHHPGPGGNPGPGVENPGGPEGPRNRAPQLAGVVSLRSIGRCETLLISALALLAGARDADGDVLAVRHLTASSGTLTAVEGGWQFTPAPGYFGPVTLSYEVSDDTVAVAQTAVFSIVEFTEINGTAGDDSLTGTECADLIDGRDGNDTIDGRGGSDILHGGAGNDFIRGGAGHDLIYAGRGNDIVHGGPGNDTIHGGEGDDQLFGEAGDDIIVGGKGNDRLYGGDGDDFIDGGEGDDWIDAGEGDNLVLTGDGNNSVRTGNGNNVVIGGAHLDQVQFGSGQDIA
ncbi:MAG: calcium-binding protein, partial [Phenylobacterium sp.]